ncbi:DUF3040 domain-containing protein [Luteipulveratus sp. YIM 133132]|uniref:DUF3040 domain-containing protein n=1 Tax=Luteipulveratus flavus TaxID=3031728 RepID=UPI0023B00B0B|nr:DUF3040 domain-containing protein [Luteipulveratus sp. YIM 133132]MDE9365695.1 DUF3040 domain-containing protein [Luteipulveratus sp. YIM 133132]
MRRNDERGPLRLTAREIALLRAIEQDLDSDVGFARRMRRRRQPRTSAFLLVALVVALCAVPVLMLVHIAVGLVWGGVILAVLAWTVWHQDADDRRQRRQKGADR